MTTWTPAAEDFFRSYLATKFGARPVDDVAQDLRCHVHEELTQRGIYQVTKDELERVFKQIGTPDEAVLQSPVRPKRRASKPTDLPLDQPSEQTQVEYKETSGVRLGCWYFCCVVVPFIVILLELVNHWCAQVFFNPIPTIWHTLLVLLVPTSSAWLRSRTDPWTPNELKVAAMSSGLALVVAIYYGLITLWWVPFAMMGLLVFGLGLIPLAPQLSWIGIREARSYQKRQLTSAQEIPWQCWSRGGLLLGITCITLLEAPSYVGRIGLAMATSERAETRSRGLSLIHATAYTDDVLRTCYSSGRQFAGAQDTASMFVGFFGGHVSPSEAQKVYFQMTGESFNTQAPPILHSRLARTDLTAEFDFDPDRGGDRVGGRVRALTLNSSRMDSHLDTAARLTYTEWTAVFHNGRPDQQEARCQLLLPPDGVVSRLTLWINGEPQEAAFAGNAQVKAAYKDVVTVQRRDPVMVTTSGPDRVLVQCFPVPSGGTMQIRLGITAPWAEDRPSIELPKIVERNFGYPDDLEHAVWLQGDGLGPGIHVSMSNAELLKSNPFPNLTHLSEDLPQQVWARDSFANPNEAILVGTRTRNQVAPSEEILVVLDDSVSMKPHTAAIRQALRLIPEERFGILIASEVEAGATDIGKHEVLTRWLPKGGVPNLAALLRAARHLAGRQNAALVWLHGPQPDQAQSATLSQMLERNPNITLYDTPISLGSNSVIEALKNVSGMRSGVHPGPDHADRLNQFFKDLTRAYEKTAWQWQRQTEDAPRPTESVEVNDQLARYARFSEGLAAWRNQEARDHFWPSTLARYQLVTPITGAVVLEAQAQYQKHGLEQADAATTPMMPSVPSVPEPSTTLLVLLGMCATLLRRRR